MRLCSKAEIDNFEVEGTGCDYDTELIWTSTECPDGKYLAVGVDYLLSAPTTGTSPVDIPAAYLSRSLRSWYIDTTGAGGLVNLTFNATQIGVPVNDGRSYGLLYRSGLSGAFTEVATSTMSSGQVTFSHLPADGVYVIGEMRDIVELSLAKTVDNISPNVGDTVTFTLTVSNAGPDNAINVSVSDAVPAGFGNLAPLSSTSGSVFSIVGNTVGWSGVAVSAGGTAYAEFTAEVMPP